MSSVHASRAAFAAVMLLPCLAPARASAQTRAQSPERQRRALAVDVGAGTLPDAFSSRCGETSSGSIGWGLGPLTTGTRGAGRRWFLSAEYAMSRLAATEHREQYDVSAGWTRVGVNDVRQVLHPRAVALRTGMELPLGVGR